jgi:serine/threonine protein kinase
VLLDGFGRAKISDFGLSSFQGVSATHVTGVIGTPAWTAPEVLNDEVARQASDVYSFGVILWELITGNVPWESLSLVSIIRSVGIQGSRLEIPTQFVPKGGAGGPVPIPPAIITLIGSCFAGHADRPNFDQISEILHTSMLQQLRDERLIQEECPANFICPISLVMMEDPVICSDGHSYERSAIEEWLRTSDRSPMTNETLANRTLIPNRALKLIIEGYTPVSTR